MRGLPIMGQILPSGILDITHSVQQPGWTGRFEVEVSGRFASLSWLERRQATGVDGLFY